MRLVVGCVLDIPDLSQDELLQDDNLMNRLIGLIETDLATKIGYPIYADVIQDKDICKAVVTELRKSVDVPTESGL
jgi:hypothetical protein